MDYRRRPEVELLRFPRYRGNDPFIQAWAKAMDAFFRDREDSSPEVTHPDYQTPHPEKRRAEAITSGSNITINKNQLNMQWVVTSTAAIDFTLPVMEIQDWVHVFSDAASSHDITVKDSGGSTIVTLTPGTASGEILTDKTGGPIPV